MKTPRFQFRKFHPTLTLARHAEGVMLQMIEFIPFGAAIFAEISKLNKHYECLVKVTTPLTQFVQETSDDDPEKAITHVSDKIRKEILDWQVDQLDVNEPSFWNFKELEI